MNSESLYNGEHMRKTKLMFLILSFVFFSNVHSQEISLSKAIKTALSQNPEMKYQSEKVKVAELGVKSAWGNFFPTLDLEGGFTRINSPIELDLEPFRKLIITLQANNQVELQNLYNISSGGTPYTPAEKVTFYNQYYNLLNRQIPSFNMELKKQNYYHGRFIAVQPLFLGGKLIAFRDYKKSVLNYSKSEKCKEKDELIAKISKIYLKSFLLENVLNVRKDAINTIKKHKKNALNAFKEGVVTKVSITKADVALSEAEANYKKDLNNKKMLNVALAELLGKDDAKYTPHVNKLVLPATKPNFDELIAKAMEYNPGLDMIEEKINQAEYNYKIKRSEFLPKVAAFGEKEIYPEYLSVLEPKWAIGVRIKINLFNGFKDYSGLEEAEHLKNEAKFKKESIQRKIKLWIEKNYKEMENAEDEFNSVQTRIKFARENLRMAEKRFNSGMGTSLEVVDAELSLEEARIEKISALYKYFDALTNIFETIGEPEKIVEFID